MNQIKLTEELIQKVAESMMEEYSGDIKGFSLIINAFLSIIDLQLMKHDVVELFHIRYQKDNKGTIVFSSIPEIENDPVLVEYSTKSNMMNHIAEFNGLAKVDEAAMRAISFYLKTISLELGVFEYKIPITMDLFVEVMAQSEEEAREFILNKIKDLRDAKEFLKVGDLYCGDDVDFNIQTVD